MPAALSILLAGALFATGGALIKSCDYPSLQRAGMRAAIAAMALFVLLPEARRWPTARILRLVPAYFGATCLFVVANTLTTAANAIFLQSAAPLWLILLGPWLLRERPSRADLVALACIAVGMSLFLLSPTEAVATAPDPQLGDWIAIASGVSYALLLLGMRWLGRAGQGEACAAIAWGNALTFPIAFALMPAVGQTPVVGDAQDWVVILVLGVFQVGVAYTLLVRAIERVPAMRASLLLMIEPALNPLITWLAHGETPRPTAIAGGALIVGAVLLGGLLAGQRTPQQDELPDKKAGG
ncbi:MAG TPA: DMT family transporter [Planctomycetota bacterium]